MLLQLIISLFISAIWNNYSPDVIHPVQEEIAFDLEASEVIFKEGDSGYKYFSYVITNVGKATAPAESYRVFLKVNGKMISFDYKTSALEPEKSIMYTSQERFNPVDPGKKLKFRLIIHTDDGDNDNNQKKGEIIL
ncbi:MAG: hypothetical protein WD398_04365 [Cyclobacteriaceae bacterium]